MRSLLKPWHLLDYAVNELVLVSAREERDLGRSMESFLRSLKTRIGIDLCIGIGRTCRQLQQVPLSFNDARAARLSTLQHTSLYDNQRIGAFSEVGAELPDLFAQRISKRQ